jgi:hypothetical protein
MKRFPCCHSVIYLIAFVSLFWLPLLLQAQIDLPKNKVIKSFPTEANQGVAVDREFYYAIGNTKITKHYKTTGELVASWEANIENSGFKHFNIIFKLWR